MTAPKTLIAGELVHYEGRLWIVSSSFNTHVEGWQACLQRETTEGTERCNAPFSDCEVI